jgi:sulfonate transport system substrate-binding protein
LVTGEGLADDVTFYESSQQFVKQHPEAIEKLIGAINDADRYVSTHRGEAAALVAATTGLDPQSATTFLARRQDSPANVLNPVVVAGQQAIADAFAKAGVIPRQIKVSDAVWHGDQSGSHASSNAQR